MSDTYTQEAWIEAGDAEDFPVGLGINILYEGEQIAVFKLEGQDEWYATQNRCPHWNRMVLSRGLTGDHGGTPKITCPLHKRSFSLESGECLTDSETSCLRTYPVKAENGKVFVQVA